MKSLIKYGVAAFAATLIFVASAQNADGCFPAGAWTALKIVRTANRICITDVTGRQVAHLHGEPGSASLEKVGVELTADGLMIDAGEALKSGLHKLVMNTGGIAAKPFLGKLGILDVVVRGPADSVVRTYFEGHGQKPVGHFYKSMLVRPQLQARVFTLLTRFPEQLDELHLRFDIEQQPIGKPIWLKSLNCAVATRERLTLKKLPAPELLFKADFDGTAEATFAKGEAKPLRAKNLSYDRGVDGQAVRFSPAAKSLLEYAVKGNVNPDCGTVAMWVKREWNLKEVKHPWRMLFTLPGHPVPNRIGSGELMFWFYNLWLRGDPSDDDDSYVTCPLPQDDEWMHVAFSWNNQKIRLYVNGRREDRLGDSASPMREALNLNNMTKIIRTAFDSFTIGSHGEFHRMEGLIDDLRIYSTPLDDAAVGELWQNYASRVQKPHSRPDYAKLFAAHADNAYERPAFGEGGQPGELELVSELRLDRESLARLDKTRFNAVGKYVHRQLAGVEYLELGTNAGSRAAFRFEINTNSPLYCFEFDYPDDAKRTADIIVQPCHGSDYVLQVGYAAGDEYPNTGKIHTHRCLYWSSVPEVAAVLMTARDGAPAALSAIRLYRVKTGGLPVAAIREPKANADGWHRSFALYYEDPSIGYDFGLSKMMVATPTGIGELIDRTAAEMKYTGENLFAYPGVWYQGLIGDDYMPREHPQDFLKAWYVKFGKEGLGVMPTLNPNIMPIADGLANVASMSDGSLHPTEIAIHDTGLPNWGGWHNTPPNFNFNHPKVRAHIEQMIDTLVEQGKDYPAFKGVCLHLTRHCLLWFGDEKSGYNDYTVKAFADECGVKIPFAHFAANPLRGKDYAEWLRANCWERWLQWRCDQVTRFYARIARKLAAARPDLKLWVNSFTPANVKHPDFLRDDFMPLANRRCGLDGAALTRAAPNVILCQALVPADYRWLKPWRYPSPAVRAHQRIIDTLPRFYDLLAGADFPWVHQHDRYWESAIGAQAGSLSSPWMTECRWRVSTINPSGRNALRHFVLPLRYSDVLGVSKGGFLIGTYGMEDVLVPFMRAFRSLPAVVMNEIGRVGKVVARQVDFDGCSYFYIVNTDLTAVEIAVKFPPACEDLVSGERPSSARSVKLRLLPYEMRTYSAPIGSPQIK